MANFQEQFKEFILNDIFWFNKTELNFGIYKIFRQKEEFIKAKLDEIVQNIEKHLSSSNENGFEKLKDKIFQYIPPLKAKDISIEDLEQLKTTIEQYGNGDTDELLSELNSLTSEEKYDTTKVYEYLYQFFNLYYEKGDFGYTPRSFRTYSIPYTYEEYLNKPETKNACELSHNIDYRGEETLFTWKTKDSYYIKSNKFLNSVTLNLEYKNQNYTINTNIIEKDEDIKDDKKVKQYRLVSIKKDGNTIFLNFNISDHATPKHTIYLAMLSVIEEDIKELDYNTLFSDKKLKEYFEKLPFENKTIQTSLLDENQQKLQVKFKELIEDENIQKHLFDKNKNIFKSELSGEEDKTQLKSKTSKLMISKKDYVSKVYTKTTAKSILELDSKEKFELDNKDDYEKLYEKDDLLNFFYRLDRGINLFYAGVDSDYFIHKNLKRFLSVELDKFIKNYIFADTDAILLMDESAKQIATFARVFKNQANIFIDLLSSIEEFQKYIWEKRKMVKASNYVISSNKIKDSSILEVVLNNSKQIKEWEDLEIIKKLEKPNIIELQSYSYPIDTKHFDSTFKYQLLSQFENIEKEVSGLLIKSENYQALKFLEPKYTDKKGDGKIKCVYIDPPYNTGNDGFVYKDSFKSASWLSMMNDRLEVARKLMSEDGVIFTSIDDKESTRLSLLLNQNFFIINNISVSMSEVSGKKMAHVKKRLPKVKETIFLSRKEKIELEIVKISKEKWDDEYNIYLENFSRDDKDIINQYSELENISSNEIDVVDKILSKITTKSVNEKMKKLDINDNEKAQWLRDNSYRIVRTAASSSVKELADKKKEKNKNTFFSVLSKRDKLLYLVKSDYDKNSTSPRVQLLFAEDYLEISISDFWTDINTTGLEAEGNVELKNGKKPENLIERIINLSIEEDKEEIVLDFFGGSGTTAAVSYKMGKNFISVEMNDYFESKMLNRMKYTMFGNSGGIPSQRDSGIVQYIELEQYDDIIDNLEVIENNDYSKVPFGYIYEPDKNQINFRMENELNNPLDENAKFDIFSSFIFHEGMELKTISLDDDILEAVAKDKYEKECLIILGTDKEKIEVKVKTEKENYSKIYTNLNISNSEQILAETFKGK